MHKYMAFLFLVLSSRAFAEQRIPVQEGMEVMVTISSNALNRIAVENDRIVTVKGLTGQFQLDKDTELGQIFLQPTLKDKDEPIHLFLTTENQHTYTLSLLTDERKAQNILLVPIGEGIASKWERSNSYENLIKSLVQAMHNQDPIEGFLVQNVKTKLPKIAGATVKELQTYSGDRLQGHILEVTNPNKEALYLYEEQFYGNGIRAVSILNKSLFPNQKTRVYLVR